MENATGQTTGTGAQHPPGLNGGRKAPKKTKGKTGTRRVRAAAAISGAHPTPASGASPVADPPRKAAGAAKVPIGGAAITVPLTVPAPFEPLLRGLLAAGKCTPAFMATWSKDWMRMQAYSAA